MAEKLTILQKIINTNDEGLIKDIRSLLNSRDLDWFDGLHNDQQSDVLEGIDQLNSGKIFSHDEAKDRFGYK